MGEGGETMWGGGGGGVRQTLAKIPFFLEFAKKSVCQSLPKFAENVLKIS